MGKRTIYKGGWRLNDKAVKLLWQMMISTMGKENGEDLEKVYRVHGKERLK